MAAVQYRPVSKWKWVGLAGVVGVAAIGAAAGTRAVRRQRREINDAEPDELRARLHARLAAAGEST
jgi:hypothetical protein